MHIIIVSRIREKLKRLALIAAIWFTSFMLGSYLINVELQFSISVDSVMDFTYPYGIVVDKIIAKESYADREVLSSFLPSRPQTEEFVDYDSLEGKFSFKYPSAFLIQKAAFTGGDILYHIDFHDRNGPAHGFVQVWNLPGDLGDFLDKSKQMSGQTYKYFKSDKIEMNGMKGFLWDYAVLTGNGYYKGIEVFLQKGERMYRLSYFLPEDEWDDKQSSIFWNMAKSLKIKD